MKPVSSILTRSQPVREKIKIMEFLQGLEHIIRRDEPLGPRTWLRIGGASEYFAEPTSIEELGELVRQCRDNNVPFRVLGEGSSILVRDEGVPGVVVRLSAPAFCEIDIKGNTIIAGAGARLSHVVSMAVREGLGGMESLVGIPGTLGGALHGNAAEKTEDIGQWIRGATVMTDSGEIVNYEGEELHFSHRQSCLDEPVILSARFELEPGDREAIVRRMQKIWIVKKAKQPSTGQCAIHAFQNTRDANAAQAIEQAGLKGVRIGQAEVDERYDCFLTVEPGATSRDVLDLINLIRSRVAEQSGTELKPSMEIW